MRDIPRQYLKTLNVEEYIKLEKDARENNNTCDIYTASTGSIYIRVNGVKFRLADHDQPSYYQMQNYTNINYISEIKKIMIKRGLWRTAAITLNDFISLYKNNKTYKGIEIKKEKNASFGIVYSNTYGIFVDIESAANNLYYNLFKKN